MLKITEELIKYLSQDEDKIDGTIISSYINSILKCGTKSDARFLLDYYMSKPHDFYSGYLLNIFEKWGDEDFAKQIYTAHINNNNLIDERFDNVLELLGNLKYEPIKQVLMQYAFSEESDYYMMKSAVLGLLNFNCDDIEDLINKKIQETYDKSLFDEFIPALVFKLKNRTGMLERLYETGNDYCSVDCNAGIILGFSLCGEEGFKYFKKVIFDNHWEPYSSSTGAVWMVYKGIRNLGITIIDLYKEVSSIDDLKKQRTGLTLLLELIRIRIKDYSDRGVESFTDIYNEMYFDNIESKNIIDLAEKFELDNEARELERLIELKLNEEQILKNIS